MPSPTTALMVSAANTSTGSGSSNRESWRKRARVREKLSTRLWKRWACIYVPLVQAKPFLSSSLVVARVHLPLPIFSLQDADDEYHGGK